MRESNCLIPMAFHDSLSRYQDEHIGTLICFRQPTLGRCRISMEQAVGTSANGRELPDTIFRGGEAAQRESELPSSTRSRPSR